MKPEEIKRAIEVLRDIDINYPPTQQDEADIEGTIELAIQALEKQVPKKPIHANGNYYCPTCKDTWLLWDDAIPNEHDNFCRYCGQKIDWSVEE